VRRLGTWVAAAALAACTKDAPRTDAPGSPASAATAAPPATSVPASDGGEPKPRCRFIAAIGDVRAADGGERLTSAQEVPDGLFAVAAGAKCTVKNPLTGREASFEGPGRARACVGGASEGEAWLVGGSYAAAPGAGEKPGAEDWVVTPFGVVRYASAHVKLVLGKDSAELRVATGSARVFGKVLPGDAGAVPAADEDGWTSLAGPLNVTLRASGDAKSVVDACVSAAKEASALAAQVVKPDAALGTLAAAHVRARQRARARCALARVVAEVQAGPAGAALRARAAEADEQWRIVP
jgi:hypothetical protein